MRMILRAVVCGIALALFCGTAVAQDDVNAIVEKAIKAHGGEANLSKYKASKLKAKGTMSAMGMDLDFTVDAAAQLPDKMRNEIKLEVMGQAVTIIQLYDGKKGWVSIMGQEKELEGDDLADMKDQLFGDYLDSLVPLLKDKQLKLEMLDEIKVDGKPAVGIKVSAKEHKDTKMYFDKGSGILLKSERRGRDPTMQEVNAETFFRDYKDISGVKQPMKVLVKHDGKKYMEAQITDAKLFEKLDDSEFKKP